MCIIYIYIYIHVYIHIYVYIVERVCIHENIRKNVHTYTSRCVYLRMPCKYIYKYTNRFGRSVDRHIERERDFFLTSRSQNRPLVPCAAEATCRVAARPSKGCERSLTSPRRNWKLVKKSQSQVGICTTGLARKISRPASL